MKNIKQYAQDKISFGQKLLFFENKSLQLLKDIERMLVTNNINYKISEINVMLFESIYCINLDIIIHDSNKLKDYNFSLFFEIDWLILAEDNKKNTEKIIISIDDNEYNQHTKTMNNCFSIDKVISNVILLITKVDQADLNHFNKEVINGKVLS
ncbi:hypothetical protein [Mycoplasma sp. P36-A1]|uniref:hypothetical protein n=1 Tax=Mycoplasma sp. P36-A1 TaxID=3252900 RepID=UPI003C308E3B